MIVSNILDVIDDNINVYVHDVCEVDWDEFNSWLGTIDRR